MVRLLFHHTSESRFSVYRQILHVVKTVKKNTQARMLQE